MNSERRHDLKNNNLAHGLDDLPVLWRKYGSKLLLGLIAILAIGLAIRFQRSNAEAQRLQAEESYAAAQTNVTNLQSLPNLPDGRAIAEQRRQLQEQTEAAIRDVLDSTKSDTRKADALVTRGELNWVLAHSPEIPGAATQASLRMRESRDDLLENAKAAYEAAAAATGASPLAIATSRLALGTIAEERKQWSVAQAEYEKLKSDAAIPKAFQDEAAAKLDTLKELQKPVLIGQPASQPVAMHDDLSPLHSGSQPSSQAASAPASRQAGLGSALQSASQPAAAAPLSLPTSTTLPATTAPAALPAPASTTPVDAAATQPN